ncbi:hypothetical protein AF79_09145 [Aliarcobacter butzleri L354]|uniref:hypothetical protein n=1 Tax=Aliarcobacter butzleri TaxID=28197 RepID=UPI00063A8F29|nr:hypothetical protein [Aliarcobacter butzleri]KLE08117.1 hypothetical protein AF79_09145 [Aliarcobacter butzleri L354]
MSDFLKDLQQTFMARIKNMLLLNFIIAWCIVNYKIVLKVIFEETSIDNKLAYLEPSTIGIWYGILLPLIFAAIYIYLVPLLNLYVVIGYNKFVNKKIQNYKVEAQKEEYKLKREVERERLETTEFLKETMQFEKDEEKLKQEKNKLELEKNKNSLQEEFNKLKLEENNQKAIELKLQEKEKMIFTEEYNILTEEYNTLKVNMQQLKLDYSKLKNNSEVYRKEKELFYKPKSTFSTEVLKDVYNQNYEPKVLGNIDSHYSNKNIYKELKNIYDENNEIKDLDTVVNFPFEKKLKK